MFSVLGLYHFITDHLDDWVSSYAAVRSCRLNYRPLCYFRRECL